MNRSVLPLAVAALIAALLAVIAGCVRDGRAAPARRNITVMFTNDALGEVAPCG